MGGNTSQIDQADLAAGNTVLSLIAGMPSSQLEQSPLATAVLTRIGKMAEQNPALAMREDSPPGNQDHNSPNLAGGLNDTQKLAMQVLRNPDLMNQIAPAAQQAAFQDIGAQFHRQQLQQEGDRAGGMGTSELFRDPNSIGAPRPMTPVDNDLFGKFKEAVKQPVTPLDPDIQIKSPVRDAPNPAEASAVKPFDPRLTTMLPVPDQQIQIKSPMEAVSQPVTPFNPDTQIKSPFRGAPNPAEASAVKPFDPRLTTMLPVPDQQIQIKSSLGTAGAEQSSSDGARVIGFAELTSRTAGADVFSLKGSASSLLPGVQPAAAPIAEKPAPVTSKGFGLN
jgi:hypothetical protein